MKKHLGIIILAALALILLAFGTVMYTVPSTEIVLVKRFGKTTTVLDGRDAQQAGLHWKWIYPVEKIVRYDGRVDVIESAEQEMTTNDQQTILLTMYCAWEIEDAQVFQKKVKDVKTARSKILSQFRSKQSAVVPQYELKDLINTDPSKKRIGRFESDILVRLKEGVEAEYGVSIVGVGVKTLALGEQSSKAVIDAMISERKKEVENYQSMGNAQAEAIRSMANSARDQILAFADRKAREIRTTGYSEAAGFYEQFQANPELGMYLRYLRTLQNGLSDNTTIWLDGTKLPAIKYFREGPSLPKVGEIQDKQ